MQLSISIERGKYIKIISAQTPPSLHTTPRPGERNNIPNGIYPSDNLWPLLGLFLIDFYLFLFLQIGPISASFCLFSFFSHSNSNGKFIISNIKKTVDIVLGIRTPGCNMVSAKDSTELIPNPSGLSKI